MSYKRVETIPGRECRKRKISSEELRMGSRRDEILRLRSYIAERLVRELGMSLARGGAVIGWFHIGHF
jgi:hypothetical protein